MADKNKVKLKDTVNPFAREQFQPKAAQSPAPAPAKKKKPKSWGDTLGDSLLYVGDYLRGVKRK